MIGNRETSTTEEVAVSRGADGAGSEPWTVSVMDFHVGPSVDRT